MSAATIAHRTCPLCEATCGLELTLDDREITAIRGDDDDVFSQGFICPKGFSLKALHEDSDRLRTPLLRREDGSFESATWAQAFAAIERGLSGVLERGGRDAVGTYIGNPNAHNLASLLYG
ncbi:MAG TPA: molybdopterin-dependent oxidoreductase, partial [Solirubrobacteraceae bacterium]|nr:molybdopterin-dependent oxidoreductase [Solirubrobacteraceae bacterium]